MSIFTTIKLAFRALSRNKVRAFLTILSIMVGIGVVIAMIAAGSGARESVAEVFRSMGTNLLIISNGSSNQGAAFTKLVSNFPTCGIQQPTLEGTHLGVVFEGRLKSGFCPELLGDR